MKRGRCLCGSVTYKCDGPPRWRLYCHCQSCRLNTASPATAFFGMANGSWNWTGDTPARFQSSKGVTRHFCSNCGSPMAFEAEHYPGEIHFYTAALEDAKGFVPTGHVHAAEQVDWFEIDDTLPRWLHFHGSETQ